MKLNPLYIFITLAILCSKFSFAQINAGSLIIIHNSTTTELNALTPEIGHIAFDTTLDRVVEYTSTGWKEILTEENIHVGYFILDRPIGATTTTTVSQSVVDIPFKPKKIKFKALTNIDTFSLNERNGDDSTNTERLQNAFGFMYGYASELSTSTITQGVSYVGASGSSLNSISRYSSNTESIGLRYSNKDGINLGLISASVTSLDTYGFTLNVTHTLGVSGHSDRDDDILSQDLIVFYTAYK